MMMRCLVSTYGIAMYRKYSVNIATIIMPCHRHGTLRWLDDIGERVKPRGSISRTMCSCTTASFKKGAFPPPLSHT